MFAAQEKLLFDELFFHSRAMLSNVADNQLQEICVASILDQTANSVDEIVHAYTSAYKEIFAHTEGVLRRSIDTGDTSAATLCLIQMYNTIDTSWRVVDNRIEETRFSSNGNNIGRLVAALERGFVQQQNVVCDAVYTQRHELATIERVKNCLQQRLPLVKTIVEKYTNRNSIALKAAIEQSTPAQRRLVETTLFQSAFCPDVSKMADFHHPNSTVYDVSLDHSWCTELIPIMQNITFFATTILRELVHDENTYETHVLFTILHIMQRMGFYPDDISHLALRIDTMFYRSIIADTQFHFIAQHSPNLYTFPGDNLFNIMCAFVDSGCCTLFANSSATCKRRGVDWWATKYVKTQAERALNDIRRDLDKGLMRYSILHGLQHLRNSTFDKLKRVATLQHIILGSPLPYAKMVLEVQQLFMTGLAQIPVFGADIVTYIECNTCFRVRGWPLVMRQHYVMFIKSILWQLRCIPVTPAVFWTSAVFSPLDSADKIMQAILLWHRANPFNASDTSDDDVESLMLPFVKRWSQCSPKARAWKWEVEESEVHRAVNLRLGKNDCARDHETLLCCFSDITQSLLRVNKAANVKLRDENRLHHFGFNAAEVIANLSEADCTADYQRKAAQQLNNILKDFDIKQSTLNFFAGISSLRPASVFGDQ